MRAGLWRHLAEGCECPEAIPLQQFQSQQQQQQQPVTESERPPFRRKITFPKYLLTSTRQVSPSQDQSQQHQQRNRGLIPRSLAQLLRFETTKVEDLAKELLNLHPHQDHMSLATREAYIGQQCQTLANIINYVRRCEAIPSIKVSNFSAR